MHGQLAITVRRGERFWVGDVCCEVTDFQGSNGVVVCFMGPKSVEIMREKILHERRSAAPVVWKPEHAPGYADPKLRVGQWWGKSEKP